MTSSAVASYRPFESRPLLASDTTLTLRRMAHGAGAALLMFAGADSMSTVPPEAWSSLELTNFGGVAQSMLGGPITGPMQLLSAVALFFAAGKCRARVVSLAAVAAVVLLHRQGVTLREASAFAENFGVRLSAAASAFMNAAV